MPKKKDQNPLRYGVVYPVVSALVVLFHHLNLVELFKAIAMKMTPKNADRPRYARIAIDIYQVIKWGALIYLWANRVDHPLATVGIVYLIGTNVFTYFYHHVWRPPHDPSEENRRSRFVSLMLAMAYNAACYAYLYDVPFAREFVLTGAVGSTTASLMLGVARSLLIDFPPLAPATPSGYGLALSQTFVVFLFITIVLSASIPQYNSDKKTS